MNTNLAKIDNFDEKQVENSDITLNTESQRTLAETQAAVLIAMKRPRNEEDALVKLKKALERISFCEKANYIYPRGDDKVRGPSVYLAREIARLWGNIQYGYKVMQDNEDVRTIETFAWDLETNAKVNEQIKFRKIREKKDKTTGKLLIYSVSERDIREITAKHGAIGVRNCILQLIPRDIIDEISDEALNILQVKIKKEIENLSKKTIDAFKKIGITQKEIEIYLNHSLREATPEEISELRYIYASIKDGNSRKDEYFKINTKNNNNKNVITKEKNTLEKNTLSMKSILGKKK